jgi:hypothetical protein
MGLGLDKFNNHLNQTLLPQNQSQSPIHIPVHQNVRNKCLNNVLYDRSGNRNLGEYQIQKALKVYTERMSEML